MQRFLAVCAALSLVALSCLGTGGYIDLDRQCTNDAECQTVDPFMFCNSQSRCACQDNKGYQLCPGANGKQSCVLLLQDAANCGKCGTKCVEGQACCGGTCITLLDGDRTSTPHKNCGACRRNCPTERPNCCDGGCRNFDSDPQSCGTCNSACESGQSCCGGKCADLLQGIKDAKGTRHCGKCDTNCSTDKPDCCQGLCADLSLDAANCGTCGNDCAIGLACCDGKCVEPTLNKNSCGACGVVCKSAESCCNGKCVELNSPTNCGTCGNNCDTGELCCEGQCINPSTDNLNCNACGTTCIDKGKRYSKPQTKAGEALVFYFDTLPQPNSLTPLRVIVDIYGDYDATNEFVDLYLCKGDVPDCNPASTGFIKDVRINGGNPKCNTSTTEQHSLVFVLSPKDLPGRELTLRAKISDDVSPEACSGKNPRIEVSFGPKQCCGGSCTEMISFTSFKPQHCGTCGQSCAALELCCQGKCTRVAEDDSHCGACGKSCNTPTTWTQQVKDGETMRFFFSAADFAKQPFPASIKMDIFGDYGEEDQFAQVFLCKGDIPVCDAKQAGFLSDFKILGDAPSCNTRLTPAHTKLKTLDTLPRNTALTVTVKLSESVTRSKCAKASPRVVASLGNKNCCNGVCTDLQEGTKDGDKVKNCGACGNDCEAGEACCQGKCVDITGNEANCGACGTQCKTSSEPPQQIIHTQTGQIFLFNYKGLPAPTAQKHLRFTIEARGDFNGSSEYAIAQALVNGKALNLLDEQGQTNKQVSIGGGSYAGPNCLTTSRTIAFTPSEFSGGDLTVQVRYLSSVAPSQCTTSSGKAYVRVHLNPELCCKGQCALQTTCPE